VFVTWNSTLEPVMTVKDPVIVTFWFSGFTKEDVKAYDALTAFAILPLKYEAVAANEAVVANEDDPNNEPVIPWVTFNEPVINVFPLTSKIPFNDEDLPIPIVLLVLYPGTGLFGNDNNDDVGYQPSLEL
jgi:hypothetical protein